MLTKRSVSDTRSNFTSLSDQMSVEDVIVVTRRGEAELAVMRWELYQGLMSTLEILADKELMDQLRTSQEDLKEGRVVTLEEFEARI